MLELIRGWDFSSSQVARTDYNLAIAKIFICYVGANLTFLKKKTGCSADQEASDVYK